MLRQASVAMRTVILTLLRFEVRLTSLAKQEDMSPLGVSLHLTEQYMFVRPEVILRLVSDRQLFQMEQFCPAKGRAMFSSFYSASPPVSAAKAVIRKES